MNVAGANTVTVPPNSSVAFPVGTEIKVTQIGAGATTFVAGAGVTINNNVGVPAQGATAVLYALVQKMWNPTGAPNFVPTNSQLYQTWVQDWINTSIAAQNITATPAPVPPPPVVIGP
jgi:hypothetical protein